MPIVMLSGLFVKSLGWERSLLSTCSFVRFFCWKGLATWSWGWLSSMLAWCRCISLEGHITGFPKAAVAGILLRISRMLCRGTKAYKRSTASCGIAENGFFLFATGEKVLVNVVRGRWTLVLWRGRGIRFLRLCMVTSHRHEMRGESIIIQKNRYTIFIKCISSLYQI